MFYVKMIFDTRYEAWEHLSILIKNKIQDFSDTLVLGILNWGAPVAQKISENLNKKCTFVVAKHLTYNNYNIWAITQDWTTVYNKAIIGKLGLTPEEVKNIQTETFEDVKYEKEKLDLHFKNFSSQQVLVVDDWVVSWLTAAVVWKYAKQNWAKRIILATPIINSQILNALNNIYDEIIVAESIEDRKFWLSKFYLSYYKLTTEDIYEIIHKLKEKNLFIWVE